MKGLVTVLLSAFVLLAPFALRAQTLPLPPRATNALSGADVMQRLAPLPLPERESEIYAQITSGNVPNFLRKLCPVAVTNVLAGRTNTATFYVAPDYLAVGSDDDYFLLSLSPGTAQRIADALNCSLPTPKMVNEIYAAAEVKLPPLPIPPSAAMTTVAVFGNHNAMVRAQRLAQLPAHPLGALVAGHQKDVVISARLAAAPGKVAIYGWHQTNGVPIQPLYLGHTAAWVDYSQCIRLVQRAMTVNGTNISVPEVLADPALAGLLSDEGVVANPRYPTNAPPVPAASTNNSSSSSPPAGPVGFAGFHDGEGGRERMASFTLEPEVKVHLNAPPQAAFTSGKKVLLGLRSPKDSANQPKAAFPAAKKVLLIIYALPNGNTIAQTVGRALKPGDDWHYDIQHIGAQTRFLRALIPDRPIVVAYLESNQKSWPAWRKAHGDKRIPELVAEIKNVFAGQEVETVLSGHSGGGSLIFGYLNAVDKIPDDVVRIAFLDSDYAYDRALGHEDKLARWLKTSDAHCLCVLAYDDAAALLNGKSFVSAAGGTWGRSHALERDLAADFAFTSRTNAGFEYYSALRGRAQFILKENPDRKVFHTVQVERNGFIHALVTGTPNDEKGYRYFGERAYSKWITPAE